MMVQKGIFSVLLSALFFGCNSGESASKKVKLTAGEFSKKIETIENPQIIDVRTPEEYNSGHIERAENIDWNDQKFSTNIAKLDHSEPVFIYCLSGGRSAAAAEEFIKNGFGEVYELSGGMLSWRSENLPETTDSPKTGSLSLNEYYELLDSDKPVLVDFYADWCVPCKRMEPILKRIANNPENQISVIRIDTEKNSELCRKLNIKALPTVKLYKNNRLIWEHIGFIEEHELKKKINAN